MRVGQRKNLFNVWLSDDEYMWLRELAGASGLTLSDTLRQMLRARYVQATCKSKREPMAQVGT